MLNEIGDCKNQFKRYNLSFFLFMDHGYHDPNLNYGPKGVYQAPRHKSHKRHKRHKIEKPSAGAIRRNVQNMEQ